MVIIDDRSIVLDLLQVELEDDLTHGRSLTRPGPRHPRKTDTNQNDITTRVSTKAPITLLLRDETVTWH